MNANDDLETDALPSDEEIAEDYPDPRDPRGREPRMALAAARRPLASLVLRSSVPGRAKVPRYRPWKLTLHPAAGQAIEPLMGWTASGDPYRQVEMTFATKDAAIAFAERQGWSVVVQDRGPRHQLRNYVAELKNDLCEPEERGRRRPAPPRVIDRPDPVLLAGMDSFPASDPPSWMGNAP